MDFNYKESCELLSSQGKFYINLELTRIQKVLNLLDNPQDKLKFIHTAGTNGKGSTCNILASILKEAGFKVGLYTSPHLVEYTERIKINGTDISKEEFSELIFKVCEIADNNDIHLTEFEILTVTAFLYFAKEKTDIVILETGLGGRFDATNVIKENICSIITSISKDHTERLGDTIEKIAFEKAGIIKKSPVVISTENAGYEVIKKFTNKIIKTENTVNILFDRDLNQNYAVVNGEKLKFNLLGLWQKENLELALKAIDYLREIGYKIPDVNIKNGLKNVRWQCRMEYFKDKGLILDGGHNVDAVKRLKEGLDFYFPDTKRTFIYGTLKNKDYKEITKTIFRNSDEVYFYEFESQNALNFDEFKKIYPDAKKNNEKMIKELIENNDGQENLIIVCGSLYMLGELMAKKIFF